MILSLVVKTVEAYETPWWEHGTSLLRDAWWVRPDEICTFESVVIPPTSWGAYAMYTLLVAALIGTVYHYRRRQATVLARTRTQIADDLHDEIGSKVSSIALRLDFACRHAALDPTLCAHLGAVAQTARQLVDDLRDTVWVIDAGQDHLSDFLARVEKVADQLLGGNDSRVVLPETVPDVLLDMPVQRNMLLVVREALHNAVRHARARRIDVWLRIADGALSIVIADSGSGFDEARIQRGRGLRTMRERMAEIGGELDVESRPGQGTIVRLLYDLV